MVNVNKTADIAGAVLNGKSQILRKVKVSNIVDKCIDLQNCVSQQKTVFGFLPITNLRRFHINQSLQPRLVLSDEEFDPVKTHNIVRSSGKYNFEGARIQLPSKINFDLFDELAKDYWDYQLPAFLRFGFPLDFPHDQEHNLQSTENNHASAVNFPDHVETYINTELAHKAIFGPYIDPPYGSQTHVSPFMSREKSDSNNRRIIIDLSWPDQASINYFTKANVYLNTVYKLQYPTVDDITEKLLDIEVCTLCSNRHLPL